MNRGNGRLGMMKFSDLTDEDVISAMEDIVARHHAKITGDKGLLSSMEAIDAAVYADLSAAAVHIAGEAADAFASGIAPEDFITEVLEIMEGPMVRAAVIELVDAGMWPWKPKS